jgi:hypothetical protein
MASWAPDPILLSVATHGRVPPEKLARVAGFGLERRRKDVMVIVPDETGRNHLE